MGGGRACGRKMERFYSGTGPADRRAHALAGLAQRLAAGLVKCRVGGFAGSSKPAALHSKTLLQNRRSIGKTRAAGRGLLGSALGIVRRHGELFQAALALSCCPPVKGLWSAIANG